MIRVTRGGVPTGAIDAAYDAAQTTHENAKHWRWADSLSAASANSLSVRKTIRSRARYEAHESNSYAKGLVLTLANDLVGAGPRLQLRLPAQPASAAIEAAFARWADQIDLAAKLRTLKQAKTVDGEVFGLLTTNPQLDGPIQLDLRVVECDQVTDPFGEFFPQPQRVDGIEFDAAGNPTAYHVLREHPGSSWMYGLASQQADRIDARYVLHLFRVDRPGQVRGVSEMAPALPLYAMARRFRLATIAAAETAADFAAVLQTGGAPGGEAVDVESMETLELERRMATVLPKGWQLSQIKSEHPATTYEMFNRETLCEIARCLNVPYNVASGNSSDYNYASGRLDYQIYHRALKVERSYFERNVLGRLWWAWLDEALFVPGLIPAGLPPFGQWPIQWVWDGFEHVDPLKEANADAIRLGSFSTSLAELYARQGKDWEAELKQIAREKQLMQELGIAPADVAQANGPDQAADDEEDSANKAARDEVANA